MLASFKPLLAACLFVSFGVFASAAFAQSAGNSTLVTGAVLDPTGAVVPNATVELHNPISGFKRTVTTDESGRFTISNVRLIPITLSPGARGSPFTPKMSTCDQSCL